MLTKEQAIEKLQAEFPNGVELYYVDYNDSLDDSKDIIQEILVKGYSEDDMTELWDVFEAMESYISEVFTSEERAEMDVDVRDAIDTWLYENDTSGDVVKQLTKNTRKKLVLADLDFYFDDMSGEDDETITEKCKEFLKHVGSEVTEKNIKQVRSILLEAYYGGNVYIMIDATISDFYNNGDQNYITFNKGELPIVILDSMNGSGMYGDVDFTNDISIPRTKLVLDDLVGYGVDEVFGVYTDVGIDAYGFEMNNNDITEPSALMEEIEKEKQWKIDYNKTGCAGFRCQKFQYHTTEYQNEPMACGNKCKICGRLWID